MSEEKALRVDGLTFVVRDDGEPRIEDLDLAERLGFKRPRAIRDLIKRSLESGALDESGVCRAVRQTSIKGGRPSEALWLNEAAALFVAAKSDTEGGDAVLRDLVRLWMAVRRQMMPTAPVTAPAIVGTVGDNIYFKREIEALIRLCALSTSATIQRVRGWMVRASGAASYRRMTQGQGEMYRRQLDDIAKGKQPPPWTLRLAAPGDPRQQVLFPRAEAPSA